MSDRKTYERLRDALLDFAAQNPSAMLDPFREALKNWGSEWVPVSSAELPASDFLTPALSGTNADTRYLMSLFEQEKARLCWEQTYTKADGVVGEDMLRRYGFVEVIGQNGPFVSERVRCGIGVWGPRVHYPTHYHGAEEVYVLLSGAANFRFDDGPIETRTVGDTVYVPSMRKHGFDSLEAPLVIFYIWQAGDLREKSKFA